MQYLLLSTKFSYFIMEQFTEHKMLIIAIGLGILAGIIAQMIVPGKGFGMGATILIGIAGSVLGNKFLMPYMTFINDHLFKRIASAIVGALILMMLINAIRGGGDNDKTHWRTGS